MIYSERAAWGRTKVEQTAVDPLGAWLQGFADFRTEAALHRGRGQALSDLEIAAGGARRRHVIAATARPAFVAGFVLVSRAV
jgi:hypothetical protein